MCTGWPEGIQVDSSTQHALDRIKNIERTLGLCADPKAEQNPNIIDRLLRIEEALGFRVDLSKVSSFELQMELARRDMNKGGKW